MCQPENQKNTRKPYIIKTEEVPERYARGWHCLGLATDYTETPKRLKYFGTTLVAFRGKEDNQVHILDAFCPHMGADLCNGHVEGDSIICPFHSWSWGPDGACDHIPYSDLIPPQAQINSWPTLEENGLLFIWNDPEGKQPIPEQRPQRINDYFSGEWSDWSMGFFTIHSNCRELVDNMADMAHFGPVHYSSIEKFRNEQDGHKFIQYMSGGHEILTAEGETLSSVATYEGPAYMTTTMQGMINGTSISTHLLVTHIPVNTEKFDIRFGVMCRKDPSLSEAENQAIVDEYTQMNVESFIQDVEIWDNKVRVDNPLMCKGDGPVHMVRDWYSQFYMDVADIPERITRKKEHITLPRKPKKIDTAAA